MTEMKKEVETRIGENLFPVDFEDRTLDKVIGWLDDIQECDESAVCIRWQDMPGITKHKVPILYVYFANTIATPSMPKLHITETGEIRPAHAVCLVSMPTCKMMDDQKLHRVVRDGIEGFLRQHNVKITKASEGPALLPLIPRLIANGTRH